MAFLVLTHAGLQALLADPLTAGTTIYVNPALADADALARLEAAGATVSMLGQAVNPEDDAEVAAALQALPAPAGVVWLERGRPAARPAAAPAVPMEDTQDYRDNIRSAAGRAWRFIGKSLGRERSLMIVPYMGYGNATTLHVRGRVLNENPFAEQGKQDSAWRNFAAFYQRLESDQVRGITVRARFEGSERDVVTDQGGYFRVDIDLATPLARSGWHPVALEIVPDHPGAAPVRAVAEALVPPASAKFGVISDIDDTVLWTNVTNKINMAMMLSRSNPFTRKPFKGVAAFYRALHEGLGGNEANPVFYVSSSPWHLYDPLVAFLRLQRIPVGPLMLRELSLRALVKPHMSRDHKREKIEAIINAYPTLPFVLIGDSGERDPEIYAEILRRHPKSVRVIYIRNVNPDPARVDAVDQLAEQVSASGAQLVLAADSVTAAAHAAAEGLIKTEALAAVRSDKRHEEGSAPAS
ncbi:DUF2183 domain-containing protein [Massilia sp. PAMC28688]|uniref:App1 family protein n=1 Tax=Massilia sp. PAMC28688 TaxID=2861283 RepID=UPI001C62C012|nr:phosphatase domain-containing protein [Massilia sp. PAMC28688]QYF94205.1 DUF2183 domain-containing protein [Massilia sp. PAMC28688]